MQHRIVSAGPTGVSASYSVSNLGAGVGVDLQPHRDLYNHWRLPLHCRPSANVGVTRFEARPKVPEVSTDTSRRWSPASMLRLVWDSDPAIARLFKIGRVGRIGWPYSRMSRSAQMIWRRRALFMTVCWRRSG